MVSSFLPDADDRCVRLISIELFTFLNNPDKLVEIATYAWWLMDYKTNLAFWVNDVDTADEHWLDRLGRLKHSIHFSNFTILISKYWEVNRHFLCSFNLFDPSPMLFS